MKKLLFLIAFCAISCNIIELSPIEKWGGKKYVVTDKQSYDNKKDWLQLKNPDTIFWVKVLKFDSEKYKIGDTLK